MKITEYRKTTILCYGGIVACFALGICLAIEWAFAGDIRQTIAWSIASAINGFQLKRMICMDVAAIRRWKAEDAALEKELDEYERNLKARANQ